jgi:putative DNA primase/helicase
MTDLIQYIADIARHILGEPNRRLSSRDQLRFGTSGSIAVEIGGPKRGCWWDHENEEGGGPVELIRLKGGITNGEISHWLSRELGIEPERNGSNAAFKILARYAYRDETGALLFEVVRLHPKDFRQRRPDGHSKWIWETKNVRKVLYRLPELIAAPADQWVFVVEGEKDADNLVRRGLVATTNPGGAAKAVSGKPAKPKWRREYNPFFRGRRVCILPDNDDCGRAHAFEIARSLVPVAADVRIVTLTGLPDKGDVSDWLAAGGSAEALLRIAAASEKVRPDAALKANPTAATEKSEFDGHLSVEKDPAAVETALPGTEDEIALEFSRRHDGRLRYVNPWKKWLQWGGACWQIVGDLSVFHAVRLVAREYAKLNDDKKLGKDAATAAIERSARNDRRHDTPFDAWNAEARAFNTPNRKG